MATDGLSELAAALRADGVLDSEGRFTLDRAEARAKMQKFQLADARRYVLELVQAALLRGASALEFHVDADDMILRFDGRVFTAAELDDLWGSLFAEGEGRELRGLRQLALGLNAALALLPRQITVESGAHRLLIRPDADDALAPAEPRPDTLVHVRQRPRLGLVLDFFRDLRGRIPEEIHLRERCLHAAARITLDGATLAGGTALPGAIERVPIAEPGVRGVIGWTDDGRPAELRLIKDGVWIDSRPLAQCGRGIVAVIEADDLRRDASLAKIVDDPALARALALAHDARWTLFAALLKRQLPVVSRVRDEVLDSLVPDDLARLPAAREAAAAVTWPDARSASPRSVSLPELADALVRTPQGPALPCARDEYPLVEPTGPPIPRIRDRELQRLMRALRCGVRDAGPELARQQAREAGRREFLRRTMAPRLREFVRASLRARVEAPALRGEVGVALDEDHPGELWVIRDGLLIVRFPLDLEVNGIYAALEADFSPSEDFSDVVRDHVFAAALLQGLASLGPALQEVATSLATLPAGRGLLKAWLGWALDDEAREALWSRLGVPDARGAPRHAGAAGRAALRGLRRDAPLARRAAPAGRPRGRARVDRPRRAPRPAARARGRLPRTR